MKIFVSRLVLALFISAIGITSAHAIPIKVSQGGTYLGTIDSYSGASSGADNYNYYSGRSHLVEGPDEVERGGQFFFYEGSDGLSFNMIFGRGGSVDRSANLGQFRSIITLEGSITDAIVLVADDGTELRETLVDDRFRTTFRYIQGIGDGGVIGEIGGDNWTLTVDPSRIRNIDLLAAYDNDGTAISLAIDARQDIVFEAVPVSEPASLALMGIGLLSVAAMRRRKKAQ